MPAWHRSVRAGRRRGRLWDCAVVSRLRLLCSYYKHEDDPDPVRIIDLKEVKARRAHTWHTASTAHVPYNVQLPQCQRNVCVHAQHTTYTRVAMGDDAIAFQRGERQSPPRPSPSPLPQRNGCFDTTFFGAHRIPCRSIRPAVQVQNIVLQQAAADEAEPTKFLIFLTSEDRSM